MDNCHTVKALLTRHKKLFEGGLGTLQSYEAKLYVEAMPKFCKAGLASRSMLAYVYHQLSLNANVLSKLPIPPSIRQATCPHSNHKHPVVRVVLTHECTLAVAFTYRAYA